jgi:hypothetical protein
MRAAVVVLSILVIIIRIGAIFRVRIIFHYWSSLAATIVGLVGLPHLLVDSVTTL